ncbi:flagellar hook assembly protein FlgD [Pseudoalteromonas sp. MMG010]|uniref:flagellar hook assembly protein FlgD n=1 Tax=Pseudoalteromonas sp. MMG010 TaxID=2822685 RepID=UPI001B39E0A6|nr:flagellar hook assembly protein FlgD [Pseudoalteromonas sp. MMG010]MBQ4831807.1 flagellar hook assembly protein FlgD [Pseudoalteromonas sp. MMG010]
MSTDISSISSSSYLDSLKTGTETTTEESSDTLTQEDFFTLLTQQLTFQDPSEPADNDQMISQMTNFTMVEGISNLNTNFESLASSMTSNSALQASTLVGKQALVDSDTLDLADSGEAQGAVVVDSTVEDMVVRVTDASGQLVKTIDLGTQSEGTSHFSWDGTDESGERLPSGEYSIEVQGSVDGDYTSFATQTFKNIESVNINNASGIVLNTKEGSVLLSSVEEIA